MQTIEFDAEIEDGKIEIPFDIQKEIGGIVHVTISVKRKREGKSFLRELIDNPIEMPNFKPLTRDEIYDRNSR